MPPQLAQQLTSPVQQAYAQGGGTVFIGFLDEEPVATSLLLKTAPRAEGTPSWFLWEDVAVLAQFAVAPKLQKRGIDIELLGMLEQEAIDWGKRHLALDVAEPAHELIAFYNKLGYGLIGRTQYPGATHRSVVLSKRLIETDPTSEMSLLELRPAEAADRQFVEETYFETQRWLIERLSGWRGDDAESAMFAEFYEPDETSIILLDGQPVGWLALTRGSAGLELRHMYIRPEHQSQGVGSFLMRELIKESLETGVPFRLSTAKINPARRLYERLGFVAKGDDEYKVYMELSH